MTHSPLSSPSHSRQGLTSMSGSQRSASPFHVAARVVFLLALFGAPWTLGAVEPWAWAGLLVLVLLALILWGLGCVHSGLLRMTWSPFYWPFLGFLLIASIQLFAGLTVDRVGTREAVLKLVINFVFFFLAGQLLFIQPEDGRAVRVWGLVAISLGFALAVLALAQLITTGHGLIYWSVRTPHGPFGPYVSANDYCGLMEMLIPVSAGYILADGAPWVPRFVLWLALAVSFASIGFSGSRGGAAVMLIEILVFGVFMIRFQPSGVLRRAFPLLAALVLVFAAGLAWVANAGMMGRRALSIFQTNKSLEVKLGDRFWVAEDTLRMARSHPWLGAGVGTFETEFPPFMSHPSDLRWTHAHDDFAEALAETGAIGGLLILWALVLFARRVIRRFQDRFRSGWGWIRVGAVVGTLGLLCHSLVDFNLRVPANAAWFVVCVAVATHAGRSSDRSPRVIRESFAERQVNYLT